MTDALIKGIAEDWEVEKSEWKNSNEIKKEYPTASILRFST